MASQNKNAEVPWALSVEDLSSRLHTSLSLGLSAKQVVELQGRDGFNRFKETEKRSAWLSFFSQFRSPVVFSLLLASVICLGVGDWVDAGVILVIVFINALIGFMQEAKAEDAVEALKKLSAPHARVLREGRVCDVPTSDVCVGDILTLEAGDLISADARIIQQSTQLSVNEAILTGESQAVNKELKECEPSTAVYDRLNMLFSGTIVTEGSARAMVTAIGMKSEMGKVAELLESAAVKVRTPLQVRLEEVSAKLLYLCLGVVVLVATLGWLRGLSWVDVLLSAISLAVAAIPEGLPSVVTVALALAIKRMTKRNAIVRRLSSVETLGSTDVICTDKTGTLTTGQMKVREVILVSGKVIEITDRLMVDQPSERVAFTELVESAVFCSNADIGPDTGENQKVFGDSTEVALLRLVAPMGGRLSLIREKKKRLKEWSFDSRRKLMSVAVQSATPPLQTVTIHVKGAPESLLPLCQLSDEELSHFLEVVKKFSSRGRRVLAVATREVSDSDFHSGSFDLASQVESRLRLLGLVAIADPPRPESIDAVRRCQKAGIRVVMITGDHPITALAIAQELGSVSVADSAPVITGPELESLSGAALTSKIQVPSVFARVTPYHKLKIVEAWKSLGSVVAMTGDGVNDAPALEMASIGVAMGKGGSEVARQASAMILVDDNFATIVGAVEEGRAIFGNIKRTVQYLLSGNLSEMVIMVGASIAGWPAPLVPIHLLWINLVTDGLPSLALAAEPVPGDILGSSSRPSPKGFFDRKFYQEMLFTSFTITVIALIVYGVSLAAGEGVMARTHVFSFLVFAELFRSFASRSEAKTAFQLGLFSNKYHLLAVFFPVGLQVLLQENRLFQTVFKVQSSSALEWSAIIALALIPVTLLELRKLFKRRPISQS